MLKQFITGYIWHFEEAYGTMDDAFSTSKMSMKKGHWFNSVLH